MTITDLSAFGERLQKIRAASGLNQRQFALSANVDTSQYSRAERGKSILGLDKIKTIAKLYNTNVDWIVHGFGEQSAIKSRQDHPMMVNDPNEPFKHNKPTPSEAGAITPDPQMPGIYQRIIDELIESSKAQRKASEAMAEISKALLEERQLIRDTASAAIDLAKKASTSSVTKTELDRVTNAVLSVEQSVEDDHATLVATQSLLLDHVAETRGVPRSSVIKELGKKIHEENERRGTDRKSGIISSAVRS